MVGRGGANEQITMNNYQFKKVDRSEGKRSYKKTRRQDIK